MKWYLPAWNGDFRLEGDGNGCALVVEKPSIGEKAILFKFFRKAHDKRWVKDAPGAPDDVAEGRIVLACPLSDAAPVLVRLTKPKRKTITAVKVADEALEIVESADPVAIEAAAKKAQGKEAARAASVSRPTLCCPRCIPGSVAPAREVLLDFLTPAQHGQWAQHRAFVVAGGTTGHAYRVSHRHTPRAIRDGFVVRDLDDNDVLHCHDWTVPPEEEALAMKLHLEHREAWIRNEASCFAGHFTNVLKNPHGDIMDGTADAGAIGQFGANMIGWLASAQLRHERATK